MMTDEYLTALSELRDRFDAAGKCKTCRGERWLPAGMFRENPGWCDACAGDGTAVADGEATPLLDLALFQRRVIADLHDERDGAARLIAFRRALEAIAHLGDEAVEPRRYARKVLGEYADPAEQARLEAQGDREAWCAFRNGLAAVPQRAQLIHALDRLKIDSFAALALADDAALARAGASNYDIEALYTRLGRSGHPRFVMPKAAAD